MRSLAATLTAVIIAAACTSAGTEQPAIEPTPTTVAADPTPTPAPEPTEEPTATPEPEPTEAPTLEPTDIEAVETAWANFIEGSVGPDDDEAHRTLALQYGAEEAHRRLSEWHLGSTDRVVEQSYPKVEVTDTGWSIRDCFLVVPRGLPASGWVSATAEVVETDNGPFIASIDFPHGSEACVPAEVATEVIAGYEAYLDAVPIYFSPPDPDHPLVRQTASGQRLDLLLENLRMAVEDGWEYRGRPDSHLYIDDVGRTGNYRLTDCQERSPDDGAYDLVTGERLDEIVPTLIAGQRDLVSVRMIQDEGIWKVDELGRTRDADCSFEPSADAPPVI